MDKLHISSPVNNTLWGNSGGICSKCRVALTKEKKNGTPYTLGEKAHIEGERPNSARYNLNMTDDERSAYDNLILLCGNCHTEIDSNPEKYTVEILKKLKYDNEDFVNDRLRKNMPNITFSELDVIIKYLIDAPNSMDIGESLTILSPKDKIKKNSLSSQVEQKILIGYQQANFISDYLNRNPDIQFAERLRSGFVAKYKELKNEGLTGDEIFYELHRFSSNYSDDFDYETAGLAVLSYFFDICEVFEK